MNKRNVLLVIVAAVMLVTVANFQTLYAEVKAAITPAKVAVVSVRTIFQNSKKNNDYKAKMTAEQDQVIAQLEKLSKEIDALQADLKTRKTGTDEYLKLMKDISDKKISLEQQKTSYQQEFQIKDQAWTEKLYVQVLSKVALVARQKGVDIVLEKDDIELPASTATELMLVIRTHKVLYYRENLDITNEVLAALDADSSNKPVDANSLGIKMK